MGSLFGGTPKPSAEEKAFTGAQTRAVNLGISGAEKDIPAARDALSLPLDFFKKLLGGDRKALMETLSPEITQLHKQYESGRKTTEEFGARGGGRTAAMAELPFREAADVSTLIHGARKEGAAGMEDIGKILADLGVGELGGSISGSSSGSSRLSAERQAEAQRRQQNQAAAGQAAGAIIAAMITSSASSGCWIAEAVYGTDDLRTHVLRAWLNLVWAKTTIGSVVMVLYCRFGERVALLVHKHACLKMFFRWLFDRVLVHIQRKENSQCLHSFPG